jgi:hypothetical protein
MDDKSRVAPKQFRQNLNSSNFCQTLEISGAHVRLCAAGGGILRLMPQLRAVIRAYSRPYSRALELSSINRSAGSSTPKFQVIRRHAPHVIRSAAIGPAAGAV